MMRSGSRVGLTIMPRLLGILLLTFLVIGGGGRQPDPIAAEVAELEAQIEAMKNHPSLLARSVPADAPASAR